MVEFDMMQLSIFTKPIANEGSLTSTLNWKMASIKNISTKILEVDLFC